MEQIKFESDTGLEITGAIVNWPNWLNDDIVGIITITAPNGKRASGKLAVE